MAFPRKYAGNTTLTKPIVGPLSSINLPPEHRELIDRIVCGLFLDMQNKPLPEIMAACFITGAHMALEAKKDVVD